MAGIELWSAGALILAGAVLLLVGGAALLVLQNLPGLRPAIRSIWPDFRALALTFTVIAATVHWHGILALPVLCAVGARIGWELLRTLSPERPAVATAAAAIGAVVPLLPLPMVPLALSWVTLAAIRFILRAPDYGHILDPLLFPIGPFALFAGGFSDPAVAPAFIAAFLLGETFDSYALLSGRLFGKHRLAPRLSPGKTIEGALGGGLMLLCTAAIAAVLATDLDMAAALGAAALIGGTTVAGDLAASRLKRQAGVKDFPCLLPPQGGLLDVIDGWVASGAAFSLTVSLL